VHEGPALQIRVFPGGPFEENTLLLWAPSSREAVIVDPGGGTPALLEFLRDEALIPTAVWLTHAHLDHVDGLPALMAEYPLPVALHPADLPLYRRAPDQARAFGLPFEGVLPEPSQPLSAGMILPLGEARFQVREAPGHAPGHVLFVEPTEGVALVGDVIFRGSVGRTDLPGGDGATLMGSIQREVLTLPDNTRLLPGHGPATTVGEERATNPFLQSRSW
jgi:hydroxyacylglutathione hydrolase